MAASAGASAVPASRAAFDDLLREYLPEEEPTGGVRPSEANTVRSRAEPPQPRHGGPRASPAAGACPPVGAAAGALASQPLPALPRALAPRPQHATDEGASLCVEICGRLDEIDHGAAAAPPSGHELPAGVESPSSEVEFICEARPPIDMSVAAPSASGKRVRKRQALPAGFVDPSGVSFDHSRRKPSKRARRLAVTRKIQLNSVCVGARAVLRCHLHCTLNGDTLRRLYTKYALGAEDRDRTLRWNNDGIEWGDALTNSTKFRKNSAVLLCDHRAKLLDGEIVTLHRKDGTP